MLAGMAEMLRLGEPGAVQAAQTQSFFTARARRALETTPCSSLTATENNNSFSALLSSPRAASRQLHI